MRAHVRLNTSGYGMKPLLSCCVPDLDMDVFAFVFHNFLLKIDPDGRQPLRIEGTISVSHHQWSLSDAWRMINVKGFVQGLGKEGNLNRLRSWVWIEDAYHPPQLHLQPWWILRGFKFVRRLLKRSKKSHTINRVIEKKGEKEKEKRKQRKRSCLDCLDCLRHSFVLVCLVREELHFFAAIMSRLELTPLTKDDGIAKSFSYAGFLGSFVPLWLISFLQQWHVHCRQERFWRWKCKDFSTTHQTLYQWLDSFHRKGTPFDIILWVVFLMFR